MKRVVTVSALLLSACFSRLHRDDNIACRTAGDCPSGYFCDIVTGLCAEGEDQHGCARDLDCPFGQVCRDAACVTGCVETGDCGLHQACIDGACAEPGRCTDDSVCELGERCNTAASTCETGPGDDVLCRQCFGYRFCLTSADCAPGDPCDRPDPELYGLCKPCGGGSCYLDGSASACSSDNECSNGEFCYRPQCVVDANCGGPFGSCSGPAAVKGGGGIADGVRTCQRGLCVSGYCQGHSCDEELGRGPEEGTCPKGYSCFSIIEVGASCTTDAQCASGTCRTLNEADPTKYCTCVSDGDCPEDTRCEDGSCLAYRACRPALGLTCEEVSQ